MGWLDGGMHVRAACRGAPCGPRRLVLLASIALASTGTAATAAMQEASVSVPAVVADMQGRIVQRDVSVALLHDDATPVPRPLLVILHGRATDTKGRAALDRGRYTQNAQWFAERGFQVAIPARIGYGKTGGADVEDTGACEHQRYEPAFEAIGRQTRAVLAALRTRADVAKDRAVVVGLSFGGVGAIALAARPPPGVQAIINFAGGGGGNPDTRPADPCDADTLRDLLARYGETARIPSLWIYAENDRYFGVKYPLAWFGAFVGSGGKGEFALMPAFGNDGHQLFTQAPDIWASRVDAFLRSVGFAVDARPVRASAPGRIQAPPPPPPSRPPPPPAPIAPEATPPTRAPGPATHEAAP
ncbi:MAG: alpha/beta hydrolase [Lautropia sp.]